MNTITEVLHNVWTLQSQGAYMRTRYDVPAELVEFAPIPGAKIEDAVGEKWENKEKTRASLMLKCGRRATLHIDEDTQLILLVTPTDADLRAIQDAQNQKKALLALFDSFQQRKQDLEAFCDERALSVSVRDELRMLAAEDPFQT